MTDKHDKPYGRSEEYLVYRLVERLGAPDFSDVVKSITSFYELDLDHMALLFAYERIRESEESILSRGM